MLWMTRWRTASARRCKTLRGVFWSRVRSWRDEQPPDCLLLFIIISYLYPVKKTVSLFLEHHSLKLLIKFSFSKSNSDKLTWQPVCVFVWPWCHRWRWCRLSEWVSGSRWAPCTTWFSPPLPPSSDSWPLCSLTHHRQHIIVFYIRLLFNLFNTAGAV